MLDIVLKYLPLLIFIAPFLAWFDKAKRFSHRRKFYVERLEAMQTYLNKYYKKDLPTVEKDCAAQALVGSEKIDHRKVDYVIEYCPHQFFAMADKLVTAHYLIDATELDGKVTLTVESTKARWKRVLIACAIAYISTFPILYANQIAIYLISKTSFLHPILVDSFLYNVVAFINLIVGAVIPLLSGLLFRGVCAALEVYDDLNLQYVETDHS